MSILRGYLAAAAVLGIVAAFASGWWLGGNSRANALEASYARAVASLEAKLFAAADRLSRAEAARLNAERAAEAAGREFEERVRADPSADDIALPAGIVQGLARQ